MSERAESGLERITAVFTQGRLLLAARGTKPRPDDDVLFEPISLHTDPPSFRLRSGEGEPTSHSGTPYQVGMVFEVGSPPDEVLVRSATREHRLRVLVASDWRALERREPVRLVPIAAAGVDAPVSFEEMLAGEGERLHTPILWPIRLGPLFDGRLEFAAALPRRSIGYSERFDFTEAFRDAIHGLPPDPDGDGDRLTTVRVTEIGAFLAGSGGTDRMFVSILAY